ncbi:MAG: LacI family transcriptional regulator [Thermobacillus sp. ZCTH02-B1]|uniref:substrate-binding domain-containing protein n=1 Tax=Thermobacillus sp. ZCTH02-B1 TaxID=1858795 RepID=UPI000B576E0C|nr:substrate-binding domain-containing protein [Thermobacillus sp. ZCTH02-B1]OUM95265.1 MAG: LacI family transcriptional regulator [Thermobacillus sp. ZCTH02-B1]
MKKLLLLYLVIIGAYVLYALNFFYGQNLSARSGEPAGLVGSIDEKYVMVTFQSGIDYWKSVIKGFEDAAEKLGVSVEYRGSTQYDAREQVTVLEQVIAQKPAGIALTVKNPEALTPSIDKAVDAGIPVVLFDAGAPDSKAYSLLATDNYNAGVTAARTMARLIGGKGKVGVITLPNQLNHQQRTNGFRDTIRAEFPDMSIVAIEDGKGDVIVSRDAALAILDAHPDLKGIFNTDAVGGVGVADAVRMRQRKHEVKVIAFDTDKVTLDLIRQGDIDATLAQGTWNMGYWSLVFLFHLHHGIVTPDRGQTADASPLPVYVDTGISVVTRENVDDYYVK